MTVAILIDETYPKFASLIASGTDRRKISVPIGTVGHNPTFYNFTQRTLSFSSIGEAGTNPRLPIVNGGRPLEFENADFKLLGTESGAKDALKAGQFIAALIDYMRKGVLKVTKDGAPAIPADILTFT